MARLSRSWNSRAEWWPWSLRRWLRAATSTMVVMLRPGRTGTMSIGISTSRMRNFFSSTPSRSYSTLRVPLDELEDDLDLLPLADRRDAEEVLDVDDPEPADLHVVLDDLGARAVDRVGRASLHVDDVVGDEPVAAHDEVERNLALADAGLAEEQDADAEHVEQHAVHRGLRGEDVLEVVLDALDEASS